VPGIAGQRGLRRRRRDDAADQPRPSMGRRGALRRWGSAAGPVGVVGVRLTIRTFLIPPTCDNLPPSGRVGGRRAGVARAGPDTPTTPGSHASLTPSSPPLRLPPPKNRV